MIKRVFIVYATLFLLQIILTSCCDCGDDFDTKRYAIESIEVFNLDNSGESPVITPFETLKSHIFGLRLSLGIRQLACNFKKNGFLINTAYAGFCDCDAPPEYIFEDTISSIKIITKNDYNPNDLAGTDIGDYFIHYNGYDYVSIEGFIEQNESYYTIYPVVNNNVEIDLILYSPPSLKTIHQFSVEVTLSNGNVLIGDSPPIFLE